MDQDNNLNINLYDLFSIDMTNTLNVANAIGSNYSITTGTNYNYSSTTLPNTIWTSATGTGGAFVNTSSSAVISPAEIQAGVLEVRGENADIKINGKSLSRAIESIEKRLAIMNPNIELEKEWSELKELGDRYRQLEEEIKEKQRVWDILKKE